MRPWGAWLVPILFSATAGADIFSPGELAKGHEALEGMRNCTQCHPAGSKLSQETCLACHTELKPEVAAGKGFHGRIAQEQRECEKCHSEHQGREFKLTEWGGGGMKAFEHSKTGWPLLGKHAQVGCLKCHERRLIMDASILRLVTEQKYRENPTMLGMSTKCDACHFDEHRGQVSKNCKGCHVERAWNPAPGFNHQKTAYPLEGKHKKVPCAQCHPTTKDESTSPDAFPAPVSMKFMRYAPIPHKECISCHEDPHKGEFGEKCARCHVVEGWLIVDDKLKGRDFHERTRYPLRGEHVQVACVACHGPWPGIPSQFKNMKFGACMDCHVDAHEAQLPKSGSNGPRCEQCHSVEGFKPPNFDLAEHDKTRYRLEGGHRPVACNACHVKDNKVEARISPTALSFLRKRKRSELFSLALFSMPKVSQQGGCEVCHGDPHAGQFKLNEGCTRCHVVASWSKVLNFNHDKDTKFPLEGKHATTSCMSCHPVTTIRGTRAAKFVGVERACEACHADAHAGQFAKDFPDCAACHGTAVEWRANRFSHEPPFTTYPLEGAHARVACAACHPKVAVGGGVSVARYKPLPRVCEACHADFHKGEFRGFLP